MIWSGFEGSAPAPACLIRCWCGGACIHINCYELLIFHLDNAKEEALVLADDNGHIQEGLYLGGWPFMLKHLPPGNPSIIDCTCELPRSAFVPTDEYICVPTWDTRAPTPYQIEFAARWACEKRAKGKPIYVHCAFGHGRSACVMCAVLVVLYLIAPSFNPRWTLNHLMPQANCDITPKLVPSFAYFCSYLKVS
ncbi:hypothetical protein GUJ93_ZPchr0009g2232 [Zizania palustris]|uniref:Tyrosine specific protein phosphatases domain-containing protein n=1 Tax=Zizania palustris TaxID=103762 RepID=A0A8J5RKU8_ZIZPA|nr:hypothetical protein GUJ93_ZPchr0009g2232 [Zizania palustris]